MSELMHRDVAQSAKALGVQVERVGVKDIVLPGEMRTLLNRVIVYKMQLRHMPQAQLLSQAPTQKS